LNSASKLMLTLVIEDHSPATVWLFIHVVVIALAGWFLAGAAVSTGVNSIKVRHRQMSSLV